MTGAQGIEQDGELRLAPESIEALARRLAELLGPAAERPASPQQITAKALARMWGVQRRWVYDHAAELGARRLGSGRRPRLRFDPEEVAERLGAPNAPGIGRRRFPPIAGDPRLDSLYARSRANVVGQGKSRPGRPPRASRSGVDAGRRAR